MATNPFLTILENAGILANSVRQQAQNTPVSPLGVTPKQMMNFQAPLEKEAAGLSPMLQNLLGPITQAPGAVVETTRMIGRYAGGQPEAMDILSLLPMMGGIKSIRQPLMKKVPSEFIRTMGSDYNNAVGDVLQGKLSKSKLPILVQEMEDGTYAIRDGNHRVAEALMKGQKAFDVITDEKAYRKLSELESDFYDNIKPKVSQFIKDVHGKFAGRTPNK